MFEEVGISFSAQSFWIWSVGMAPIFAYSVFCSRVRCLMALSCSFMRVRISLRFR